MPKDNILDYYEKKDLMGNIIRVPIFSKSGAMPGQRPRMSYSQKLKEAKAKKQFRQFQAEERREQVRAIKSGASKTGSFLKKTGLGLGKKLTRDVNKKAQKQQRMEDKYGRKKTIY